MYRVALRILGSPSEAEDAVQESFARAYDALSAGKYDEQYKMEAWLVTITTRVAIDMLRSRDVRARVASPMDPADVSLPGATDEQLAAIVDLANWMDGLPPDQRAAVVLKYIEGMSSAEVGEVLGVSEGAIEQRLFRARATLKKRMGEDGS